MSAVRIDRRVDTVLDADVVVVGSGVGGLSVALGAAPATVHLLSKVGLRSGSSPWAQGGMAAAVGAGDSADQHARDTLVASAGLGDPRAIDALTGASRALVERLVAWGARFDRDADGRLALGREGAHGRRRILHAGGDATGAELVRALATRLIAVPPNRAPRVFEQAFAQDLALDDSGRVTGVVVRHADGRLVLHRAPSVVLASGGFGQLYAHTTNPPEATGDGLAMAARAGAVLADLAFVQFHPTALAAGDDPLPLLTEALRGEGAVLIDAAGERFMPAIHHQAELAPRDVVARAIARLAAAGRPVFLDARAAVGEAFPRRFPTVWASCRARGLDPRREPLPVTPAAHYAMAGIAVDLEGRSSLEGLWACGEVAATGVHGANRLASNSLLEAMVFGDRIGRWLGGQSGRRSRASRAFVEDAEMNRPLGDVDSDATIRRELRARMWRRVGLERCAEGLEATLAWLDSAAGRVRGHGETRSLVTVGRLVTAAALARRENRGAHWRSDGLERVDATASRAFWTYDAAATGSPLISARPPGGENSMRRIA